MMTHFKPTVDDYTEIDSELEAMTVKLASLTEKLSFKFGQHYSGMLVKASWNITKTRFGIKEKMEIENQR